MRSGERLNEARRARLTGTSRGDDRTLVQLPVSSDVLCRRAGPYNIHTNVLTITPKSPGLDSNLVLLLLFVVVTSGWS